MLKRRPPPKSHQWNYICPQSDCGFVSKSIHFDAALRAGWRHEGEHARIQQELLRMEQGLQDPKGGRHYAYRA